MYWACGSPYLLVILHHIDFITLQTVTDSVPPQRQIVSHLIQLPISSTFIVDSMLSLCV